MTTSAKKGLLFFEMLRHIYHKILIVKRNNCT